jgi:hypothetical protein
LACFSAAILRHTVRANAVHTRQVKLLLKELVALNKGDGEYVHAGINFVLQLANRLPIDWQDQLARWRFDLARVGGQVGYRMY